MKNILALLVLLCLFTQCENPKNEALVIDADIAHFWLAFDRINAERDSTLHLQILEEEFLSKGTPGLAAFRERREYTAESYLNAIYNYPKFWASVRNNMQRSQTFSTVIDAEIDRLKAWYPNLKPAKIYFTVGALMSNGTTMDSLVLIGAETAMADSTAVTEELPERLGSNLRRFFDSNPINDIVLLNVHEYVHT